MKKLYLLTAMLLAFALGFLMPVQQLQAQTIWSGAADISWYDASQNSFDISTPEQLAGIAQLMTNQTTTFNGKTLNLTSLSVTVPVRTIICPLTVFTTTLTHNNSSLLLRSEHRKLSSLSP